MIKSFEISKVRGGITSDLNYLEQKALLALTESRLFVPVTIRDVKNVYGQKRFLIEPIGGKGSTWVDARRVSFQDTEKL